MSSLTDPFPSLDQLSGMRFGSFDDAASGHGAFDDAARSAHRAAEAEAHYGDAAQRGYDDGLRAGLSDAQADVSFALTALHSAIEELDRRDRAGLAELSDEVVDLALAIAETVLGRELSVAANPGRDAVVRALDLAPDRGAAVARLHPEDLARIGELAAVTGGRDLELVGDDRVERGGCILEVGPARVDAQIGAALGRVREALTAGDLIPAIDRNMESVWIEGGSR